MTTRERALKKLYKRHENISRNRYFAYEELRKNQDFRQKEIEYNTLSSINAKNKAFGIINEENDKKTQIAKKELYKIALDLGQDLEKLDIAYSCEKCKDTGFLDNKMCDCLKEIIYNIEMERYPELAIMAESFEKVDFSIYEEKSEAYKKFCYKLKNHILNDTDKNIITLSGKAGIGKTYVASMMIKEAVLHQKNVFIINAIELSGLFLKYHLAPIMDKQNILNDVLECDVLLLDDLGTEPIYNNVTCPYLYKILVERINKKTIITTNLTQTQISETYQERIFSRLFDKRKGMYVTMIGKDLRL